MGLLKALVDGQDGQAMVDLDGIGLFGLTTLVVALIFFEVNFGAFYEDLRRASEIFTALVPQFS